MNQFYQFIAESLAGEPVAMDQFAGKWVLVVNTASKCGFTPQYQGLEELYQKYKDHGLVILGFPCNQFGGQEPGGAESIAQTCHINYGVSFPMFAKVDVNGSGAHPIFKWLTQSKKGLLGAAIKWNFTKFLIGPEGEVVDRFAPITTPEKLDGVIEKLLGNV